MAEKRILTLHPNGQWVKKIRGRLRYFGTEYDAAVERYLDQASDLRAGREPVRPVPPNELTLARLIDAWLDAKHLEAESGGIEPRTFTEHLNLCEMVADHFGETRRVTTIAPLEWGPLRAAMASRWGAGRLGVQISRVKSMMHWAYVNRLLDEPLTFGDQFTRPTAKHRRRERSTRRPRLFAAEEIRTLLGKANATMAAMILLGVNGGMGQADISALLIEHVDLRNGIIETARPKTGIERDVPLWPRTVRALAPIIGTRTRGNVFITHRGAEYVRRKVHRENGRIMKATAIDTIKTAFTELGAAQGFYQLRAYFATIAHETGDAHGVARILGHEIPGMSRHYVREISVERLRKIVDHVHLRTFAEPA